MPRLCRHILLPLTFVLVVADFWIKFEDAQHKKNLLDTLGKYYDMSVDWMGSLFHGIILKWEYIDHTIDIFMPNYIAKTPHPFQHNPPSKPKHAPQVYSIIV